jgi:adenylylsulfate kinase
VSPYKDQRDKFKSKMGDNIVEVYIHTSELRGREDFFVKDYQPPTENYLDIDTTNISVDVCKNLILQYEKDSR